VLPYIVFTLLQYKIQYMLVNSEMYNAHFVMLSVLALTLIN